MKRVLRVCRTGGCVALGITAIGLLAACQSTGRLAEYDFAGSTLYTVYELPPRPDVLTGPYLFRPSRDPVEAIVRVGGAIAREVAAADVRERLDAAAEAVDIPARMGARLSPRAARYLRAELVEDEDDADFGLEVRIREYGIDAERWDAAAHFFVDAQVILFDALDGREIWESRVREREAISPLIFGRRGAAVVRDVVTAAFLGSLEEEEIALALEGLGDFAADRISERLRNSLDKVR